MIENVSKETLESVLDTLPVEFSFIDETDTVRIFNKNGDRIFPRPRSVIGRRVQDCHPSKSLHKVQQILDELKAGTRDVAEFWIDHRGMKVLIRYFPVRGKDGQYLGCLEVSQDITEIQKITGERRLLT
ncbi:MAG: PAS domain-containing protein [Candidatus Bathyarchaeota archaeon]|jgi:PAS domain S-box-containing protein